LAVTTHCALVSEVGMGASASGRFGAAALVPGTGTWPVLGAAAFPHLNRVNPRATGRIIK
jgi:hypothetical protein